MARAQRQAALDSFIHTAVRGALISVDMHRDSIRNLIADLPQMLLSHFLVTAEQKTTNAVVELVLDYVGDWVEPEFK